MLQYYRIKLITTVIQAIFKQHKDFSTNCGCNTVKITLTIVLMHLSLQADIQN